MRLMTAVPTCMPRPVSTTSSPTSASRDPRRQHPAERRPPSEPTEMEMSCCVAHSTLSGLLARTGGDRRLAQAEEVGLHLQPLHVRVALQLLARQEVVYLEYQLANGDADVGAGSA